MVYDMVTYSQIYLQLTDREDKSLEGDDEGDYDEFFTPPEAPRFEFLCSLRVPYGLVLCVLSRTYR
jgi:hypothetical protein